MTAQRPLPGVPPRAERERSTAALQTRMLHVISRRMPRPNGIDINRTPFVAPA
jgi:hypothetical protein